MEAETRFDSMPLAELEDLQAANQRERDRLVTEAKEINRAITANRERGLPEPGPGDATASTPRANVAADARMGEDA